MATPQLAPLRIRRVAGQPDCCLSDGNAQASAWPGQAGIPAGSPAGCLDSMRCSGCPCGRTAGQFDNRAVLCGRLVGEPEVSLLTQDLRSAERA